MSRKLLMNIHLYLATFLTPIIVIFAISGGLYLFGIKGNTDSVVVYQGVATELNVSAENINNEVDSVLANVGVSISYEYIKQQGNKLTTRPTSREFYVLEIKGNALTITQHKPDLIKSLVELHKGHGPSAFKTLQKLTALGLIFILLSGLWMGLITKSMRNKVLMSTGAGILTVLLLAFL